MAKTHGGQGKIPKVRNGFTTATSQGAASLGSRKIVTGSSSAGTKLNVQRKVPM